MSFTGNLFSKLRLGDAGMSSLLPQYTSPPSHPVDEHQLAELSPRPEDPLMPHEIPGHAGSSSTVRNGRNPIHVPSNRDNARVKASVAFNEPPWSPGRTGDIAHDYRAGKRAYQTREPDTKAPEIWRPSFASEDRDPPAASAGLQLSFFESIFTARPARPAYTEPTPSTKVDQSFKLIERRERQMQQELQRLLDAQDYALEKHLANTTPDDDDSTTQRSGTSVSDAPNGHVIPVRQPKKRHLSKREARLGISRCMGQLSDLKNEEEAYIATALAERKSALSRLRNLSTKRNSIVAEMEATESDHSQPFKTEIGKMEQKHRAACEDILKLEERIRVLTQMKTNLESRIAEAKSSRDSELSGYKGALSECDKRINDMMNYPEVSVLEVEGLMAQDADLRVLVGQHISGFEFLSLRPERRTLPMAKDWWEGEVQVLELRKTAVDKERGALDEGTQLWQDMLGRLDAHDQHLKLTFDAMAVYSSKQRHSSSQFNELGQILKEQYAMCKETTHELEELYEYTEAQGWNLLVTALGAEINYFHGLKAQLGDTLHAVGWADGVVTPRAGTPTTTPSREDNLLGVDDAKTSDLEEELTGSILRRWDGTDELRRSISKTSTSTHTNELETLHHEDSDGDNEVPPGLFSEVRHESDDDEHNEVPSEFLSMHSPLRRKRTEPVPSLRPEVGAGVRVGVGGEGGEPPGSLKGGYEDRVEGHEDEENHHPLSRESSANEVPPDLLAENHHALD
ncbi:hypothetical protein E0Z10_g4628 [Xylaria hypoxylon]|uniref:Autophagy-related protein 28 n=1 Tax=Xylaria hypoxylon TaxID=37992 RepID=A0A4Z0YJV6_9PEZI|nr:hypothetical protein E0Z10_g4628 [Xylaria hypoxylon]